MKNSPRLAIIAFLCVLLSAGRVMGQELMSGTTTTEQKMTSAGTLQVDANATLNVNNHPDVQFDDTNLTGDTLQVKNYGLIEQTGTGGNAKSGIDDTTGADGLTLIVTNNASGTIQTTAGDAINISEPTNNITVNNYGTINSQNTTAGGNQAIDLNAVTSGSNTINNYAGGLIEVTAADSVRPGVNGYVYNDGTIKSTDSSTTTTSDGIDAQNNTGVSITNGSAIMGDTGGAKLIEGARHGITGGAVTNSGTTQFGGYQGLGTYSMTIVNNTGATIQGDNGSGINIDGFGINASGNVENGQYSTNESVSVTNHGTISGNGVYRDGDGIDVDGDVTVDNFGTIVSVNSYSASGHDFSEGITVGGGSITNESTGTIEGKVTMGNSSASGRGITLAGVDQDVNGNEIPIESIYENSSVTNNGLIKGDSDSAIAVLGTTGGYYTVTITNNATGTLEGKNSGTSYDTLIGSGTYASSLNGYSQNQAVVELDDTGNTYVINNYGNITQDSTSTGTAVAMHGSSNTFNLYGGTITGDISGDTAADSTLNISPGAGNTLSYGYKISNFTVNVNYDGLLSQATTGTVILSGASTNTGTTNIKGGKLLVENASGSATGTGSINNAGGTLGGYGTINPQGNSLVSVTSGGTLAPGTTGNTDTLTLSASGHSTSANALSITGATLTFNLNTVAGVNYSSSLSLTGAYSGEVASLSNDTFNFNDLTMGHTLGLGLYTLIVSDSTTNPFAGLTNPTITGLSLYTGSIQINTIAGGDYAVQLNITAAATPEPSTWALIVAGGLGLIVAVRRQRRNAALQPGQG